MTTQSSQTIESLLMDIGLSEKESEMYITLLRHGNQPTSYLAKKAGMNRGTAFVILHSLLQKGLAMKTVKNKIQYFSPLEPNRLIGYLEHKENQISAQKEKMVIMISQFMAIRNPHTSKPKIEFFDGPEGARAAFEDTLNSKEKLLRSFLSIADMITFLGTKFFEEYTKKRIRKGYTLHTIRTLEKDKAAYEILKDTRQYITSKKDHREVRHVTEDLAFPMTMYLYDHKVLLISSPDENFAVLIESKEFAEMQKKLFELIWVSLKGKPAVIKTSNQDQSDDSTS